MKYLPILSLIFLQCGILGIDDCSNGYFSIRDDIQGHVLKDVPDMSIALGDTLWIKDSDYWENNLDCSFENYGNFWTRFVSSNPEIAKPIILNDYIGLIPISKGKTDIDIIGSIGIRKEGEDKHLYETLRFNLTVEGSTSANNHRPKEVYNPFFAISEIKINPFEITNEDWFEIEIITNPDFEVFTTPNGGNREGFYVTIVTSLDFDKNDVLNQSGLYRNFSFGSFQFPWDSTSSTVYGLIEKNNPTAWNAEKESFNEKMNYYTAQFFGIKSYPLNVPLKDRNFEVFAIN